jgi:protoheme IX farnesyltransferase
LSGRIIAVQGETNACVTWLFCKESLNFADTSDWLHSIHRVLTLFAGILLLLLLFQTWRTQHEQTPIMVSGTMAAVLFLAQVLMGIHEVKRGYPDYLRLLHGMTALGVWTALVVQTVFAWRRSGATSIEVNESMTEKRRFDQVIGDYLMLTKPIVVALLLVTTLAGMVVADGRLPSASTAFWVLLGGAMAAGGSSAINQYIDRYDDEKMQRTNRRPIPSRRITPAEGLAFGTALALASFYLMVVFVNWLAALLTLGGIVYYVLIYSLLLKKTTVQNIVIGGGAGAIPPLVGWAAATGHLNIPALFLFAIVFLWTPPHFWALALVRRKDYARAGVPMLPVVHGEQKTRWQIFVYTIELVLLTLLLPLFGLGGAIYLVAAILLGSFLLFSAWRVWRKGGNKLAWKMYRHSSMYLALLFIALMADALL